MHEQTRKPGRELLLDIQYVVRLRIRSKQQSTRERWHVIWNQQNVYRPVSLWWQYTWDNTHSFWNPISMSPAETMPTVVLVKRDTKIATSWGMGEVIWWGWRGDYYSLKRRSPSKLSLTIVVLTHHSSSMPWGDFAPYLPSFDLGCPNVTVSGGHHRIHKTKEAVKAWAKVRLPAAEGNNTNANNI